MTHRFVKLGSVCEFSYGNGLPERSRSGGNVPVYGSNGIVGWHSSGITSAPVLIIGRKGSIGEVHYSNVSCWPIDTTYYVDHTKQPCDLKWLYYILLALDLNQLNKAAAVPGLNRNDAYDQVIPFPSLAEQQRIAGILARADRLRQLRRTALQLSEGYLQSVFLQMFGDPVTNPMGWEIRPLGQLLTTIDSGFSPVCQDRPAFDNEWGILKLGAVTTCNYLETENKAITSKTTPRADIEVESGDLLFSRKNTYDLVGACAYVHHTRPKLMLPDLIFRLQIRDKKALNPIYLWQLLTFPSKRKMVQRLAGGSAGSMPNISKGRLNTVEIPLPSPELQSKFACAVRQYERLRSQQHEAVRQTDHLFTTLLHRAFRGEL